MSGCTRSVGRRSRHAHFPILVLVPPPGPVSSQSMLLTNVYRIDPTNLGDTASTPARYFNFPAANVREQDVANPTAINGPAIIGGGGLLYFPELEALCGEGKGPFISWGMGHNSHDTLEVRWPQFLRRFALHGIRDWGSPYPWVPCASCMHPAFDLEYDVLHEVVLYEHKDFPTGIKGLPTYNNSGTSVPDALRFLASAETVITTSYHGAFWATLLQRRVVVVDAFSTKFQMFRHPPVLAAASDWRAALRLARSYPLALDECRRANERHYARVLEILSQRSR